MERTKDLCFRVDNPSSPCGKTDNEEVDARSTSLFTQVLLSYKLNPQSVFFIGYSDSNRGMLTENDTITPMTLGTRSLFMKIGYAWRP